MYNYYNSVCTMFSTEEMFSFTVGYDMLDIISRREKTHGRPIHLQTNCD
jgi:hypothetical protein